MALRSLRWWYWTGTAALLGAALAGWPPGLPLAAAFVACQTSHYWSRAGGCRALPVQVRLAYLAILAAGAVPGLGVLHWLQLAGTCSSVLVDYCPLARAVSLAPWNRRQPLTMDRLWRTFASPPVRGSVLDAFDR